MRLMVELWRNNHCRAHCQPLARLAQRAGADGFIVLPRQCQLQYLGHVHDVERSLKGHTNTSQSACSMGSRRLRSVATPVICKGLFNPAGVCCFERHPIVPARKLMGIVRVLLQQHWLSLDLYGKAQLIKPALYKQQDLCLTYWHIAHLGQFLAVVFDAMPSGTTVAWINALTELEIRVQRTLAAIRRFIHQLRPSDPHLLLVKSARRRRIRFNQAQQVVQGSSISLCIYLYDNGCVHVYHRRPGGLTMPSGHDVPRRCWPPRVALSPQA